MPAVRCGRRAARNCLRGGWSSTKSKPKVSPIDLQYIAELKECKLARDLERGRRLHSEMRALGIHRNIYVGSTLVSLYARCGRMDEARQVFDGISKNVVAWTALILGYVESGESELALEMFEKMERGSCSPDAAIFVAGIMACGNLASAKNYSREESLSKGLAARKDEDGCGDSGDSWKDLMKFLAAEDDDQDNYGNDRKDVKAVALEKGRKMHQRATAAGFGMQLFVANSLVTMYSQCGSLADARAVFERMPCHSLVSWTALIQGCVENSEEEKALELFSRMQESLRCLPDARSFVPVLAACCGLAKKERESGSSNGNSGSRISARDFSPAVRALERGMAVHLQARKQGFCLDVFVANKLINMYAKCGSLVDARRVFDTMVCHDVVTWTALLVGYVENGKAELGWELFERLVTSFRKLEDPRFMVAGLMACASLLQTNKTQCLERVAFVHHEAEKRGCDSDIFLASTLVDLYAKCGNTGAAQRVFDAMPRRDVVSWTALVLGYVDRGKGDMALELYYRMQREGCAPDARTYVAALMACGSLAENCDEDFSPVGEQRKTDALKEGKSIHSAAVKGGFHMDRVIANTLVDMYSRCGSMAEARAVFDEITSRNVVSWNSLLLGYVENGENELCLELFEEMQRKGYEPDAITFVVAFKACGNLASGDKESRGQWLDRGISLHRQASLLQLDVHNFVANTLIAMYAKCGSMDNAQAVFHKLPLHNVSLWNSLLSAYVENGRSAKALELYKVMRDVEGGCQPNARTYVPLLLACSKIAALEAGKAIHGEAVRSGMEAYSFLATSLVEFYSKCGGNMALAEQAFNLTPGKSFKLWSALIAGYSRLGDTSQVLVLFRTMSRTGLRPDGATFCSVLTACSHAGLVNEGKKVFEEMVSKYGVTPGIEHYHCMVDLLGRANQVEEAVKVVKEMPFEASEETWTTVLSACSKWHKVEIERVAFEELLKLERDGEHLLSPSSKKNGRDNPDRA